MMDKTVLKRPAHILNRVEKFGVGEQGEEKK
jgi:hypothetical protein